MIRTLILSTIVVLSATAAVIAEDQVDWPAWRGENSAGSTEAGNYPTNLSPTDALWSVELPGKGCSTPIVSNGSIYVTAPIDGDDSLLCYDTSGKEAWRVSFGKEVQGKHRNGSGSNASPVTDGETIFVYFKSGTLAAVTTDGKLRWKTDIVERFGKDTLFWDHGTSPVVTQKYCVLARMHNGESWLAAFDKLTGKMVWKEPRNYVTKTENDHGYTTPQVIQYGGEECLLVWGAEHLTIHRSADGKLVWSADGFNPDQKQLWPAIATPVLTDNVAVVAFGRNDRKIPRLFGVQLKGEGDTATDNHIWTRTDIGTFVPSPVAYKGNVYLVRDRGEVECIDPATGESIWSDALPKGRPSYYASPMIAGDLLFAPREDGVVFVARIADDRFQLLSENDFGEPVIGSPVPTTNRILIRGERHLYCFERDFNPQN